MNNKYIKFCKELETLININSMENGSNTPDYILAEYLTNCLINFDSILSSRDIHKNDKCSESNEPNMF